MNVCAELELLEVKVLLGFLGTAGFLLRREGRRIAFCTSSVCIDKIMIP